MIDQIMDCQKIGMSLGRIAAHLNELLISTKQGGKGWQATTVRRVIHRQAALVA